MSINKTEKITYTIEENGKPKKYKEKKKLNDIVRIIQSQIFVPFINPKTNSNNTQKNTKKRSMLRSDNYPRKCN